MKTKLSNLTRLLLLSCSFIAFQFWSQDVITSWDFHNSNTIPNVGTGSVEVWGNLHSSFPNSNYGKCWQLTNFANQSQLNATRGVGFIVNTSGYGGITLTFSQRASGPASRWARLDYSLDAGLTWFNNFWSNAGGLTPQDSWQTYSVDMSSVVGADNNPDFRVRIVSIFSPVAFDESNQASPFSSNAAYMRADEDAVYAPNSSSHHGSYSATGSWRFDNVSFSGLSLPVWASLLLPQALNTTYGTESNIVSYILDAGSWAAPISVSPEPGFEISTQATTGFGSITLHNLTNGTTIYVRTLFNKPSGTFNQNACLVLSTSGAPSATVLTFTSNNNVALQNLQIIADDVSKELGQVLIGGAGLTSFSSSGLISGESIQDVTLSYGAAGLASGTGAQVGVYADQVLPSLPQGSFLAANYQITYVPGAILVTGFTPGNLILNRIGDGTNPLGSIAYPLNLLELFPDGLVVQTLGQQFENNNLLTETGELNVATGYLNSVDNLVGIPGFAAAPGTNDLAQTQPKATNILSTAASVTARVVLPTTGPTLPFLGGYLTSLIPLPNNCFYAAGIGSSNSGGVWYFDGNNYTQLSAAFSAIRTLEVFNEQLYFSTAETPAGIYQVGVGLPVSAGQSVTLVLATPSPRGFSFSPDGQLAYIADDQPVNGQSGGGIQKWKLENASWTKIYTHGQRANGLLVDFADSLPKLYASTFLSSPGLDNNKLIVLTDSSQNAFAQELASSGTNFLYKGLDFSPAPPPASPQVAQVEQPSCTQGFGKVHLTGLPAGQWRITGFPGGSKTGTGSSALIEGLAPGQNYTFKVTSYTGRSSSLTTAVAIQAAPELPANPSGQTQQKRCVGALLSDLSLVQSNLIWYPTLSSTQALASTTPLVHQGHYYAAQLGLNGCESSGRCEVEALVLPTGAWKGSEQGSWKQAQNWCGGVPAVGATVLIPAATTVLLDTTATLALLTIAPGAHLKLKESKKLSVDGDINLQGQLTLEDKATLVQATNSAWTGNGTVQLQQYITGTGQTTPNGRFWFLGAPMPTTLSSDFSAQTANVLKYFSEPLGSWQEITGATTPIEVGKGYFVQSAVNDTLVFNGSVLNNGSFNIPCTRTGTTNYYRGFNLVANPYASYLDFDAVSMTNLLPTMWYRTADPLQTMVFDTYNAQSGLGTSLSGIAVNQFIPPLQSFWVKIPDGNTTGSIGFTNAMRSHHSLGYEGLKNTAVDFPAFIRLNLEDGLRKDQLLLYFDQQVSSQVDVFDAEKMLVVNYPQCYTLVNGKKLVINALKLNKKHHEVPVVLELPTAQYYTLNAVEINVANGLILLEDKQLGVFQDLGTEPSYTFFGASGVQSTRFVLHFNLPHGNTLNPLLAPVDASELAILEDVIDVTLNGQAGIKVELAASCLPNGQLQLYDLSGRLVFEKYFDQQVESIPLPSGAGTYFLNVHTQNQTKIYKLLLTN